MKKKELTKIIISLIMLISGMLIEHEVINIGEFFTENNVLLVWYLAAYMLVGGKVLREAAENILNGQVFDENFLMALASIGAFLVGEYEEALAVMVFYQIGELFQSFAVNKSRKSIADLMDIKPDVAYVLTKDGKTEKRKPEEVKIGEIIVVKPGERVPLDGKITDGTGALDTKALTGESVPREVFEGCEVVSGSISVNGVLKIEVTKEYSESTVAKILELVENAGNKKAKTEKFITKFAKYYTPIVVISAVVIALVFPVIEGLVGDGINGELFTKWVYRSLSFLVTSCPCALVISVPLSFFGGIGGASAKGVLVKGSNYLEILAKCDTVVFDKTGTLTKGNFKVEKVNEEGISEEELIYNATLAEYYSNHPISKSLKTYLKENFKEMSEKVEKEAVMEDVANSYKEIAGQGIKVDVTGREILAGNKILMENNQIEVKNSEELGTIVYVAVNGKYAGNIVIADEIKPQAKEAIKALKSAGVKKCIMLTGDKEAIAKHVGGELGIDELYAELLPGDKVSHMEEILKAGEGKVAFVGDGINDAPVLARADIGVAMGALGSDAAIEAADVVLMDDNPKGIAVAMKIARKTLKIVKQNIVFALGVKVAILILAALGITTMWAAVFADVGVAFIAIINALRAMRI